MKNYIAQFCKRTGAILLVTIYMLGCAGDAAANDGQTVKERGQTSHAYLHEGKFAELDALVKSYSKPGDRNSAGMEKMRIIWEDFKLKRKGVPLVQEEVVKHRELYRVWISKSTAPAVPGLLWAELELEDAWTARGGGGVASTVSPAQFAAFRERIARVMTLLDGLGSEGRRYSYWYELRLEAALLQGWNRQRYEALHREAITAFPDAVPLYSAKTRYLNKMWYGSREEVLHYIDKADREHAQRFGPDVLYALLHFDASDDDMFVKGDVDWKRFSSGYKRFIERYPAPFNVTRFAWFTCQHQYFYTFREQMRTLEYKPFGGDPDREMSACESKAGSFHAVAENRGLEFGPTLEGPHMLPKP